ncbi:MAG: FtsX-like permease family protein [Oscillospiraceae bacterium]|nr:FtsX-like permease family protein [Oscillospiraceae bacterium]
MLMLIWNNIARRRTQSVITITITTLTIFVFVMVMGIFQVVTQGLELSRERLGADAILVPKYASASGSDLLFTALPENIYMDVEVLEQAKQLEGIAALTPQFYNQTLDSSCCDTGTERRIVGYDPETDFILTHHLEIAGQNALQPDEVIMGSNYSPDLIGQMYFLLGKKFTIVNTLKPTGSGMDDVFFMDMDVARQLCLDSPEIARGWVGEDPFTKISVIMVKFSPGTDGDAFVHQVEDSGLDCRVVLTSETISTLQKQLEAIMKVMFALWMAALAIAVLALTGRFNALAKERQKEIGLLRAIGLTKGKVFGLIIGETGLMALMGGILGSVIALLCMNPAIDLLREAFVLSPSVWSDTMAAVCGVTGVVLAVVLGFVSAVSPALKSASMDPQTAITRGEVN